MFNLSQNPYVAGNPVGKNQAFIGRSDVLREVNRVFSRKEDNAIVLFGQRRIGKTSVLQYLEKKLSEDRSAVPLYFDLQDKSTLALDEVVRELAQALFRTLNIELPDLGNDPQGTFETKWLPEVLDSLTENTSIVLLFDEFDVLAAKSADQAGSGFFPYLRKLLNIDKARLNFVFVIGRNVNDLDTIALSLFKGVPTTRVSLLSKEDTDNLCRLSEDNDTLIWSDETLNHVWQYTNGHAFFTQQLCSHVWEYLYDKDPDDSPEVTIKVIDKVIQEVLSASRNTLEWLWDGLPPAERVVSSALAAAGERSIDDTELQTILHESGVRIVIRELEDAPRLLKDWDLLESIGDGYRFRVELLRRWILENKPLNRVQEELDRIEPVAESLYQAAQGLFSGGELEEAERLLKQSLGLNPNHVAANQSLADILLAQEKFVDAREMLERLYEYQPGAARSRLVQVLLNIASQEKLTRKRGELYEHILEIDPQQLEAKKENKKIWEGIANKALKNEDYEKAEEAYHRVGNQEEADKVIKKAKKVQLNKHLSELKSLENSKRYNDAEKLLNEITPEFSDIYDFDVVKERINNKLTLSQLYYDALTSFKKKEKRTAIELLLKVISIEPSYEDAFRYLYILHVGEDPEVVEKIFLDFEHKCRSISMERGEISTNEPKGIYQKWGKLSDGKRSFIAIALFFGFLFMLTLFT